jgi:hypothetical protein
VGGAYDEAGEGAAVGAEELHAEGGRPVRREAEPGDEELVDVALQRRPNAGAARVQRVVEVFAEQRRGEFAIRN